MKTIKYLILFVILGTLNTYAGDVKSVEVSNGIIQLRSSRNTKWVYALDDEVRNITSASKHYLLYDLELYTDGIEKQYCLRVGVRNMPTNVFMLQLPCAYIPSYAKFLIKLEDDSVVELTSMFNKWDSEIDCYGHFFIEETVLKKLFGGVKKIRMEFINFDPKTGNAQKEFRDAEYKKDKFGEDLKDAYDAIQKEYKKNEDKLLKKIKVSTMTDINEGF